jgi:ATP-binding cassette subfamily C protein LapB
MLGLTKKPSLSLSEEAPSFSDDQLAGVLARLAVVQGHAIPRHRFEMASTNAQGALLENLSPELKAQEVWLTLFSTGEAAVIKNAISRQDMPLLWISADKNKFKILKGVLSDGSFSLESELGQDSIISANEVLEGITILLRPGPNLKLGAKRPKSALDWFIYAILKRKGPFVEGVISSAMISILALATSFYTMQVYDRVIPTQSNSTLIVISTGVIIAMLLELMTQHVRNKIVDKACQEIDNELSGVFFGKMLSIRLDARPNSVGTFASQIRQFEMVRNFMTSSTLLILADAPFLLFFIFIIWTIGGEIALVPLMLLPISIGVGLFAKWKISTLAEDQLEEGNLKNGLLVEAIDGIESIKAIAGEWKMLEVWKRLTTKLSDKELTSRTVTNLATSVTQIVQKLSYVLLIAFGAYAIGSGKITMGALIACSILSNRALSPITQIAGKIVQWQHAKVALKGLDYIMKLPTDRNEDIQMVIPQLCHGRIKAENATFAYRKDAQAIDSININISPGEKIAILGPVGSGKSTLIKILSGLYLPSNGKVFIDDVDMSHIDPDYLRESIGYLTQDIRLFNGSLRYNLSIGLPSPSDAQILKACSQTGLINIIKGHSKGLELPIFEGGRGLSGGQKQLVGLTRMLIAKPKILLLDEPTASMDSDLELKVMKSIFTDAVPDAVIILSTHKPSLLGFVNRIIILDKGKIVFDGPRDEAIAKLTRKVPKQV